MCGIAVAVGWPEAEKAVRALLAGMSHRGDVSDPSRLAAPRRRDGDAAPQNRRL